MFTDQIFAIDYVVANTKLVFKFVKLVQRFPYVCNVSPQGNSQTLLTDCDATTQMDVNLQTL